MGRTLAKLFLLCGGISLGVGCQCLLGLMVQSSPHDYESAHAKAVKQGKPLAVFVTASWCPPCQRLKKNVIPKLKADGVFDNVALAMVDVDKRPELARKLMGGKKSVPQFVIFHKRDGGSGWRRLTVKTVNSKTILKAIKSVGVSHP